METIGTRIKQSRKENGLTQKQLAERLGLRSSVISFYETGERTPSIDVLIKLSRTLHVSIDYLLGTERTDTLDVSGLDTEDRKQIKLLVEHLRKKNC